MVVGVVGGGEFPERLEFGEEHGDELGHEELPLVRLHHWNREEGIINHTHNLYGTTHEAKGHGPSPTLKKQATEISNKPEQTSEQVLT